MAVHFRRVLVLALLGALMALLAFSDLGEGPRSPGADDVAADRQG